jgi:hypothetical protein
MFDREAVAERSPRWTPIDLNEETPREPARRSPAAETAFRRETLSGLASRRPLRPLNAEAAPSFARRSPPSGDSPKREAPEAEPAMSWKPLPLNGEVARSAPRPTAVATIARPTAGARFERSKPRLSVLIAGLGVVGAGVLGVGAAIVLLRPHAAGPASEKSVTQKPGALAIVQTNSDTPPETSLLAEPPVSSEDLGTTPTVSRHAGGSRSAAQHAATSASRQAEVSDASADFAPRAAAATPLSLTAPTPILTPGLDRTPAQTANTNRAPTARAPTATTDPISTRRSDE